MILKVHCDGGARGNPGPAASAFVVYDESDQVVFRQGKFLGQATNNQAEYEAVLLALDWLSKNYADAEIEFVLDSQLVVNQLMGNFKIKNEILKRKISGINNFIFENKLKVSKFSYVSREKNYLADSLVNLTLDKQFTV